MTAGLYFLKLELNYLDDSTFNTTLTEAQRWRYVQLYLLAKKLNAGGKFIRHDHELTLIDIAYSLHLGVDQLQEDLAAIMKTGLIAENGHGPFITLFEKEQMTPRTDAQRSADKRERDTDETHSRHVSVTTRGIESESESEGESESDRESVSQSNLQQTTDDLPPTGRKTDICKSAGIPPKYSRGIIANDQISPADILAELTRNYSRKGKVKNPGMITGMNLSAAPIEKPSLEWYDQVKWLEHLPSSLVSNLGLVTQSEEDGLDNQIELTTRSSIVKEKVKRFLGGVA